MGGDRLSGLSDWANAPWRDGFGIGLLAGHATLVGSFDNAQYDPVLWSLVHEMRISLIFPLLVLAIITLGPRRSVAGALALMAAGVGLNAAGRGLGHPSDYFKTLYYLPCFVAGILLARGRHGVMAWFSGLSAAWRPRVRSSRASRSAPTEAGSTPRGSPVRATTSSTCSR